MRQGHTASHGGVRAQVHRAPRIGWGYKLRNFPNLWRGYWRAEVARLLGIATFYGRLYATVRHADGSVLHYGLVATRLVTDTGVAFIVDGLQNIVEPEIMKYHGVGTGTTAEAAGQTALVTECTTALNPDSTRATGTLTEGATGNIYRSVGTTTFDAAAAITEHSLFSQAATGGGVMFDRSVFSAINVISGDTITWTYDWVASSGG